MSDHVESVVDLTAHGRNDESSVNGVKNKELDRKGFLHAKSWMGASKIGVDLLVDTGPTCNLMFIALCKRLGFAVTLNTQTLVSFFGVSSKTVGVIEVVTTLGGWSKVLQCHLIARKMQLILGFPRLKELDMGGDCGADCLTSKDVKSCCVML